VEPLLAVLSKLHVAQLRVLPEFQGGEQGDDCAKDEMTVPEGTGFGVTSDWSRIRRFSRSF